MNRADRRAASRGKRRQVLPQHMQPRNLGALALLGDVRPYDERELLTDFLRVRSSYDRLRDGTGDGDDFARVAIALNLAKLRAADISDGLLAFFDQATEALNACRRRKHTHGRYGFSGDELQAMAWALDTHEEIVRHSTPRQMTKTLDVMSRALQMQDALGQQVAADLMDHSELRA